MAQPSSFIARYRTQVTAVLRELRTLRSMAVDEYQALGGDAFVDEKALPGPEAPEGATDITAVQFHDAIACGEKIATIAANDMRALYVVTNG